MPRTCILEGYSWKKSTYTGRTDLVPNLFLFKKLNFLKFAKCPDAIMILVANERRDAALKSAKVLYPIYVFDKQRNKRRNNKRTKIYQLF